MIREIFKYFSIQILLIIKNIFFNKKINLCDKKTIFIVNSNKSTLYRVIKQSNYNNFLIGFHGKNNEINSNHFIYNSKNIPNSNAEFLFFENNTFSKDKLPTKKSQYVSLTIKDYIKNIKINSRYFVKNKYFIRSIEFYKLRLFLGKLKEINEPQALKFIPFNFSRNDFLNQLTSRKINYVVLRGFENIENIKNFTDDIDMLISSFDINQIDEILNNKIGLIPVDLYSDNGESKTSYSGLPYYPSKLAKEVLNSKVLYNNIYIPNDAFYLKSYIYHLVFHKSIQSGIDIDNKNKNKFKPSKNYINYLNILLKKNKVIIEEITLFSLYNYLALHKFLPGYDLILKLQQLKNDEWYDKLVQKIRVQISSKYSEINGMTLFLIRENSITSDTINLIEQRISDFGFYIIRKFEVSKSKSFEVNSILRGGKWDIGPYQINSGFPKICYVLFDPYPTTPTIFFKSKYPHLENLKSSQLKIQLRNEINSLLPKTLNSIHSSDDFYEAIFYMETLLKSKYDVLNIISECENIIHEHKVNMNSIKSYSRFAVRAKVDLILWNNKKVIRKTYKRNKLEYLKNEIWFLKTFGKDPVLPKLLDHNDNYIIIEYFENATNLTDVKLKIKHIKQLKAFFGRLYNKKITLLDINPTNVLIDSKDNIKIIDFEYAQPYKINPKRLHYMYELKSFNVNQVGVYPSGNEKIKHAYNKFWKDKTKLTLKQFLYVNNYFCVKTLQFINYPVFSITKIMTSYKKKFAKKILKVISIIKENFY